MLSRRRQAKINVAGRTDEAYGLRPVVNPQAASRSGERISASPISTASTPASARRSSSARERRPDSATITLPSGIRGISSKVRSMSTSSVVRSRLLIPISSAPASSAGRARAVVDLDEHRQPGVGRLGVELGELRGRQRRDDQQDRVGAGRRDSCTW